MQPNLAYGQRIKDAFILIKSPLYFTKAYGHTLQNDEGHSVINTAQFCLR